MKILPLAGPSERITGQAAPLATGAADSDLINARQIVDAEVRC